MNKLSLCIAVLLLTACSSDPKPQIKPKHKLSDVNVEKNDTKDMKELKDALSQYTKATINKDINTLISFIYPKAFTILSKEKMTKMLKKTFASGKVPTVKDVKHTKIDTIEKYDGGLYSIITSSMTTIIKSPRPNNKKFETYMLETLQKRLSSRGTVTLDKKKHLFNIQHINRTIALNETGKWKFIGFKQAEKYISKGIFPTMLIEKLK
jgi:hypothetical protein